MGEYQIGEPADPNSYVTVDAQLTGITLPKHTLEVFRSKGNGHDWWYRKLEVATGENVGGDGPFDSILQSMREASDANPEITHITVNVNELWSEAQKIRRAKHEAQLVKKAQGLPSRAK